MKRFRITWGISRRKPTGDDFRRAEEIARELGWTTKNRTLREEGSWLYCVERLQLPQDVLDELIGHVKWRISRDPFGFHSFPVANLSKPQLTLTQRGIKIQRPAPPALRRSDAIDDSTSGKQVPSERDTRPPHPSDSTNPP